ncbi:MAG: nucleotidyltransferase family protein [Candidatus Brocadiia bacterium]
MIDTIEKHRRELSDICEECKIRRLEVFGSAATGEFRPGRSDVDFIVEFESPEAEPGLLSRYLELCQKLESLLGTEVEIITPQSVRNPYFRRLVDQKRERVYG